MSNVKDDRRAAPWYDLQTRLENYKRMQRDVAKKKGCLEDLMKAPTLTQARKVVYGNLRYGEKK